MLQPQEGLLSLFIKKIICKSVSNLYKHPEFRVHGVHIFRESVDDSTEGGCVEKTHGTFHDVT